MRVHDTLLDALHYHERTSPNKPALKLITSHEKTTWTYAKLAHEVARFEMFFRNQGDISGQVILLFLKHCPELYPAFLGAMKAGAIPAILPFPTPKQNPETYWSSHKILLDRVRPAFVIGYQDIADQLTAILPEGCGMASLEDLDLPAIKTAEAPFVPTQPGSTALLQHSSGTTGLKKGVMLSYEQIARQVASYGQALELKETDVVISWLPLYHDMGLISSFLLPISAGLTIVSMDPFEWVNAPLELLAQAGKQNATLCWMPNFAFSHMRQHYEMSKPELPDLSKLRAIISCSEPVRADTLAKFSETFAHTGLPATATKACYAMAETVFAVTQSPMEAFPRVVHVQRSAIENRSPKLSLSTRDTADTLSFVSNGPVVDGLEVRITNDTHSFFVKRETGTSGIGEIQIRGDFLFSGYYRTPQTSRDAFTQDGWYKTGDIGFADQGEIFICGREKELLIIHGKNYYAGDIEQIVNTTHGVKAGRCVAFSIVDARSDSEECVIMVESLIAEKTALRKLKRDIKSAVYDGLTLTVKTVDVVAPGMLSKTTSGKTSRAENKAIWLKEHGT